MDGRGDQDAITDIVKCKICDIFIVMWAAVNDDLNPFENV
jgi:hypothetical protein